MRWSFAHMQLAEGGSVYLRLSTRAIDQPTRELTKVFGQSIISGGYWKKPPKPGAELAIVYCGAVAPEADTAYQQLIGDIPNLGLLSITSPDRLHANWLDAKRMRRRQVSGADSEIERLVCRSLFDEAHPMIVVVRGTSTTPRLRESRGCAAKQNGSGEGSQRTISANAACAALSAASFSATSSSAAADGLPKWPLVRRWPGAWSERFGGWGGASSSSSRRSRDWSISSCELAARGTGP